MAPLSQHQNQPLALTNIVEQLDKPLPKMENGVVRGIQRSEEDMYHTEHLVKNRAFSALGPMKAEQTQSMKGTKEERRLVGRRVRNVNPMMDTSMKQGGGERSPVERFSDPRMGNSRGYDTENISSISQTKEWNPRVRLLKKKVATTSHQRLESSLDSRKPFLVPILAPIFAIQKGNK